MENREKTITYAFDYVDPRDGATRTIELDDLNRAIQRHRDAANKKVDCGEIRTVVDHALGASTLKLRGNIATVRTTESAAELVEKNFGQFRMF